MLTDEQVDYQNEFTIFNNTRLPMTLAAWSWWSDWRELSSLVGGEGRTILVEVWAAIERYNALGLWRHIWAITQLIYHINQMKT